MQDAQISLGTYASGAEFQLDIKTGNGVYVLIVDGNFEIAGTLLGPRDAIAISEVAHISGKAIQSGSILVIHVPMMPVG